ncbi:MAG TPA: helix-hairpin-helix domain-containing protein [Thermodesulfobacteriota bacterium]|nr:helix-hairpin-helix domain-containing protein [Thermodesulfobacteriota bacterium]
MAIRNASKKTSNSLLYLALLCLLIYLVKTHNDYSSPSVVEGGDITGKIYVEIDDGTFPTVRAISKPEELAEIRHLYNIDSELKNGSKVILYDGKEARTGRISGLKSLSLGIPIGINSASAEGLEALPGIGEKLALRIVAYRNQAGGFKDADQLLNVNGMGEKKLALVKPIINLD